MDEADFRISPLYPDLQKPRSEHVLMIEVQLSSGTEKDKKRSLLSAIVTRLHAAGTDPNDVMVFFGEIDRASSSFGGGRPALPVEVRPSTLTPQHALSILRTRGSISKTACAIRCRDGVFAVLLGFWTACPLKIRSIRSTDKTLLQGVRNSGNASRFGTAAANIEAYTDTRGSPFSPPPCLCLLTRR